jgi:hypothetical protein
MTTYEQLILRQSTKAKGALIKQMHYACDAIFYEPITLVEVLQKKDGKHWKEAIDAKYNSLLQNKTWELVDILEGRKVIGYKWVLR